MPYDGLALAAVRGELAPLLIGGRIERVQQPERLAIIVQVRNHGRKFRLLITADAQAARMHLTENAFTNPLALPVFCSVLRKHLEGGRIMGLEQLGYERIARLVVEGRNEIGILGHRVLVAEFMGKHSNIILLDGANELILDGIKRYTHAVSRHREVLPGIPYLAPPNDKLGPAQLDIDEFIAEISGQPMDSKLHEALQKRLEGLSLPVAREIVHRSDLPLDTRVEFCGHYELRRTWETLQGVLQEVSANYCQAGIFYNKVGRPVDFAPIDLSHLSYAHRDTGTPNEIADRFYVRRVEQDRLETARHNVRSVIVRSRKKLERKLHNAESTLQDASKADLYRVYGALLTANLYRLNEAVDRIELEDFYTGEPVTIELDLRLTPALNAQAYFKRYHKQKKAVARAEQEAEILTAELRYLDELETAIEIAESLSDLAEIRAEMVAEGYLRETVQKGRRVAEAASEPRQFTAPNGQIVLVGRNNRQNDIVTFRLAGETDIWLHARGVPGAHVILRTGGQPPEDTALEFAAGVAASFSKSRQADKVAVDYTLRRFVKKPKGAKPGFVIYSNEKTVQVAPISP
ncbi:MAG: NFACT family protein [Firmicutes bacterium]|jgi:predicted ribosome quality control (RQC) complex YloA/Tae2 family protein|nr:NFACT family protein [Bacillota bacterium]MBU4532857.1 NFACT family protein [Bacillota bacterium]MBU4554235.1 NFACT family protein [Bacillota bacterium]MBV1727611.1 NFACT family protein [Desulforudis sp.]MBV1770587.1 NFACT family protein [Desulforudis sp.]